MFHREFGNCTLEPLHATVPPKMSGVLDTGEVHHMLNIVPGVKESYWGKGIGKGLLCAIEARASINTTRSWN